MSINSWIDEGIICSFVSLIALGIIPTTLHCVTTAKQVGLHLRHYSVSPFLLLAVSLFIPLIS